MTHVATVASTRAALAYLDTCIVSGLAKGDLSLAEEAALLRILQARKAGSVELFTSEVTREEISKIPAEHRTIHFVIYGLLADVPLAKTHYRIPPFRPAPMFRRQIPSSLHWNTYCPMQPTRCTFSRQLRLVFPTLLRWTVERS